MKLQLAVLGVVVLAAIAVAGAFGGSAEPLTPASVSLTATTATGKIVIARSDGSGRRFLTRAFASSISPDGARGAASPVWGPTAIAFSTVKKRGARRFTFNAAVIQPDGKGFRQLTRFHRTAELYGLLPRAWSADGTRLLAGLAGLDAWAYREAYAVDPIHGGSRLIAHSLSPSALSLDGRYVIGQTGDAETTGLAGSNIVRVPWARGGRRHILLRHAVEPSFNG